MGFFPILEDVCGKVYKITDMTIDIFMKNNTSLNKSETNKMDKVMLM